mmetsp:Transcript_2224/g.3142  ORF Transcript_2224/g.3142 Transcript_2224/m.3142 type:complete len:232 (-) Transcript_2224:116-811(-)
MINAPTNDQGLPIRPDSKNCEFYMNTGRCKFGITCKYNHPADRPEQKAPVDPNLKLNEKGYPSRPGEQQCEFYLKTGDCKYGTECRFDHPFNVSPDPTIGVPKPDQVNSKGYPIRYGEQPCTFYMKSGECKFGPTCRFNHPEKTMTGEAYVNSLGYPMRPGQPQCTYYVKTGECKFGATCKWDHPEMSAQQIRSLKMQASNMQQQQQSQTFESDTANGTTSSGKASKWDQK